MADNREIDPVTEQATTGHEWDGIKELDTPLPRWWLWLFYITIIWSVAYWIAMPAWPLIAGYTEGVLGYSQRERLSESLVDARAAQSEFRAGIDAASLEEIRNDPALFEFAVAGGRSAFGVNCSPCHGTGGAGAPGYPNLNDDSWIWGGTPDAIFTTITVGIRSSHPDTRFNQMPAFLEDGLISREQTSDVVEYVLAISGQDHRPEAAERGKAVFAEQCASCHGEGGQGVQELGSPNLTDAIWLYGGSREDIWRQVAEGRNGVMPGWENILDEQTRKQLAIFVHTLGGGGQ